MKVRRRIRNVFCATGPGGGVDPSCSSSVQSYSVRERGSNWQADFELDGKEFTVQAGELIPGSKKWSVDFAVMQDGDYKYSLQRDPNISPVKVLSTVGAAIIDLVESKKPDVLSFSAAASEPSRVKAYDKLSVRLAKQLGYKLFTEDMKNGDRPVARSYRLTRNARRSVNPLRRDPTRTAAMRVRLVAELKRRFARLKGAILAYFERDSVFNAFCPTGPGGGVDPTCGKGERGGHELIQKVFDKFVIPDGSGYPTAKEAKAAVTKSVGARLKTELTTLQCNNFLDRHAQYTSLAWSTDAHERVAQVLVDQWAESSNEGPLATAVQLRAKEVFGLKDTHNQSKNYDIGDANRQVLSEHQPVIDAYLKATYDHTQAQLKAAGIEYIRLYRGMHAPVEAVQSRVKAKLSPLSSWSYDAVTAEDFSRIVGGTLHFTSQMYTDKVHRSRIFSTWATGAGCKDEREVIVLGGTHYVFAMQPQKQATDLLAPRMRVRNEEIVLTPDADDADWPKRTQDVKASEVTVNAPLVSDPQRIAAFQKWLRTQVQGKLSTEQLWEAYAKAGYLKGQNRAFDDINKKAKHKNKDREATVRTSFNKPVSTERIKVLAGRSYADIEGVTDQMSTRMTRKLADGLVQGKAPKDIARDIAEEVDIALPKASAIARTEIIRAHAEGQLQMMDDSGIKEVGVAVEWATAGDDRVCDLCASLEGAVLSIDEARGMLPRHPNCRCAWLPANVGESDSQKDTYKQVRDAIRDATTDDGWGPGEKISKERPVANRFCATGEGGGVDPTCGKDGLSGPRRPKYMSLGDVAQYTAAVRETNKVVEAMQYRGNVKVKPGIGPTFVRGGKVWREAGHCNLDTGDIVVYADVTDAGVVAAHEVMHGMFEAVSRKAEAELNWAMKHPVSADATTFATMRALSATHLGSEHLKRVLARDDGITPYSEAYWRDYAAGKVTFHTAVHETLAEMASEEAKNSQKKGSPAYRELYDTVQREYKRLTARGRVHNAASRRFSDHELYLDAERRPTTIEKAVYVRWWRSDGTHGLGVLDGAVANRFCATGEGGGVDPTCGVGTRAPARLRNEARRMAKSKIRNAPVPNRESVLAAREELRRAREEGARPGGENRGGSAASRRKQRENLFKEFGGEQRGYVVCPWTGIKMHWTDDPVLNPKGYPKFERGKIFTKRQGGGYQLHNLIPESFAANRARNDKPIRKENLS